MTDHAAEARRRLERAWARMSGDDSLRPLLRTDAQREQMIATAQVHATLALAEQQRIANIIALATPQEIPGQGMATISIPSYGTAGLLRADIATTLGLTPTTPNQEQ